MSRVDSREMVIGRGQGGGGIIRNQELGIRNQAITNYEWLLIADG